MQLGIAASVYIDEIYACNVSIIKMPQVRSLTAFAASLGDSITVHVLVYCLIISTIS